MQLTPSRGATAASAAREGPILDGREHGGRLGHARLALGTRSKAVGDM